MLDLHCSECQCFAKWGCVTSYRCWNRRLWTVLAVGAQVVAVFVGTGRIWAFILDGCDPGCSEPGRSAPDCSGLERFGRGGRLVRAD